MAAAPVEDEDTKTAIVAFCRALPELATALPGGWHDGPIPTGSQRPSGTYARITCTQGPRSNMMHAPTGTGSGYHDFHGKDGL